MTLDKDTPVGCVVVTERKAGGLDSFCLEVLQDGVWTSVEAHEDHCSRVHILRFPQRSADAVRLRFLSWKGELAIAELGVYAR